MFGRNKRKTVQEPVSKQAAEFAERLGEAAGDVAERAEASVGRVAERVRERAPTREQLEEVLEDRAVGAAHRIEKGVAERKRRRTASKTRSRLPLVLGLLLLGALAFVATRKKS